MEDVEGMQKKGEMDDVGGVSHPLYLLKTSILLSTLKTVLANSSWDSVGNLEPPR